MSPLNIILIESDPFARSWLALLMARDCRTRVIGEAESVREFDKRIEKLAWQTDLVILCLNSEDQSNWIRNTVEIVSKYAPALPALLLVDRDQNDFNLRQAITYGASGYLVKGELGNSIAWAAALTQIAPWITSPSSEYHANKSRLDLPRPTFILDGRQQPVTLSDRRAEAARLAFLFSLERPEIAEEMGLTLNWVYTLTSSLYDELRVDDLLKDQIENTTPWGDHKIIVDQLRKIKKQIGESQKKKDMETYAYHLLTMPEVIELK